MKLLFITCLLFGLNNHDVQVALFKIHQDEQNVYVDFFIEKDEILQSLTKSEINFSEATLKVYIQDHFTLVLNDEEQKLFFKEVSIKNKHIHLQSLSPFPFRKVNTIGIFNSCLIDLEDHSNILEIRLNNEERDFLMNKNRTSVKLVL